MVTNKSKRYFFLDLHFVLVLNALVHKSSDLLEFNQTHNAAMFSSECETFALQIHHICLQKLLTCPGFSCRAGLGIKFVKIFRACIQKLFYNIKSNHFFVSWRRFVVLTAVTSVSEAIVIFLQLILFANTAAFFYSLLGLVSQCFWQGDSGE